MFLPVSIDPGRTAIELAELIVDPNKILARSEVQSAAAYKFTNPGTMLGSGLRPCRPIMSNLL
jgi:hypothetical protein